MSGRPLSEIAQTIEDTVKLIQSNPEENISEMKTLQEFLGNKNVLVVQMTILALAELFVDIAPLYKIDKQAHDDKISKGQISKEERAVLNFELRLLKFYEQFTQSLVTLIRVFNQGQDQLIQTTFLALCRLLANLFHFNQTRLLAQYVVFGLVNPLVKPDCYACVKEILSNKKHSTHELKMHVLVFMQKVMLSKPEYQIPDDFIELVQFCDIDNRYLPKEIEKEEREKKRDFKKKKREFFSQKEKDKKKQKQNKADMAQQKKLLKEVQEEKEEAMADLDRKTIAKHNGELLSKIFYIYFKIIKAEKLSKFYDSALEGMLKFVHLINVELIQSLITSLIQSCKVLKEQQNKNNLQKILLNRLSSCFALQSIINGPGQVFQIDDKETTAHFYYCLVDTLNRNIPLSGKEEQLIIELIQVTFVQKRHFSQEVAASFIKILISLCLKTKGSFQYTLLYSVKLLLQKYTKTQKMVEEDNEGFGLNAYNAKVEDPSSTNALNSSIVPELQQLKKVLIIVKQAHVKDQKLSSIISKISKNEALPNYLQTKKLVDMYIQ